MESLRDQKAALETGRDLLQAALEELRKDVDDRIRRSDGVSPFPSCSEMDRDEALQVSPPMYDEIPDLSAFCEDVQQRIAIDPASSKVLHYSLSDIRCFLAGMAMSRLHLLQGISGTGKTSLPLAMARALGAGSTLVEVQAGWRDRQDLIGHFNAFERRFYEAEFLQALYRAQCPRYANSVYIVVLDEMNLSHPEQYFADLLSALEQDPQHQKLDLMTASVEPAPALLQNGRTLPLPGNVWFVGTANHDETTKDFADKTYDRAHVMELPRHREFFKPKRSKARPPVSLTALQGAFSAAQGLYQKQATDAYRFVDGSFADILGRRFRVGWGNRLERQMLDFVPVVLAGGGTLTEAVDHVLSTKLLRKIRDRHDTRPEDLEVLRIAVEDAWPRLRSEGEPLKSKEIICLPFGLRIAEPAQCPCSAKNTVALKLVVLPPDVQIAACLLDQLIQLRPRCTPERACNSRVAKADVPLDGDDRASFLCRGTASCLDQPRQKQLVFWRLLNVDRIALPMHPKRAPMIALGCWTSRDEHLRPRLLIGQDKTLGQPFDDFSCGNALSELLADDVDNLFVHPNVDVAWPGVLHGELVHLHLNPLDRTAFRRRCGNPPQSWKIHAASRVDARSRGRPEAIS